MNSIIRLWKCTLSETYNAPVVTAVLVLLRFMIQDQLASVRQIDLSARHQAVNQITQIIPIPSVDKCYSI